MRMKSIFIICVVGVVFVIFFLVSSMWHSILFLKKDRVNVVFYGQETVFFSFGLSDGVNYQSQFDNDLAIKVPGGYAYYKIGSLGRLAQLEKKPDLIQKAFSSATSTFIDFYFYPQKPTSYFKTSPSDRLLFFPASILFSLKYSGNASLPERIFLFFKMIHKRKNDFVMLETKKFASHNVFSEKDFADAYKGYFYQKSFRQEGKNVQLLYRNSSAASTLARSIEGEGIHIIDLSNKTFQKADQKSKKQCILYDNFEKNTPSLTGAYLARELFCALVKNEGGGDMMIDLSDEVEKIWE